MKLHDFGLWFWEHRTNPRSNSKWSTTIPHSPGYNIYYDGKLLAWQDIDLIFHICTAKSLIIRLRNSPTWDFKYIIEHYKVGRILTIDDFEIIPNPNYKEIP